MTKKKRNKFSIEDREQAVLKIQNEGRSCLSVARELQTCPKVVGRWVNAYKLHGKNGLSLRNKIRYTGDFKLQLIEEMLKTGLSLDQISAKYLITQSLISKWRRDFERYGASALFKETRRGRPPKMKKKSENKQIDSISEYEKLLQENKRLRAENDYLKKLQGLNSETENSKKQLRVLTIQELRQKHSLSILLNVDGMARSTFYYHRNLLSTKDKYALEKKLITEIFHQNKGRYGYRRITLELRNRGLQLNHKTVLKLMKELGLKCKVRIKKYRSYKGDVGRIAPNILERNFKSDRPNQKWVTDVTEFSLFGTKCYLSPIMDLYNKEIISYNITHRPTLDLVTDMVDAAFKVIPNNTNLTLHSDQGWHYQHITYRHKLKNKGVRQSMSRKGNCLDNAVIENFFGLLKSELLYLQEFSSMQHFLKELKKYMYYYNNTRIKMHLNGLSPVKYRTQYH
ncbi:IS3 family transposase [Marinifilum fragile]|uniref:IS3 family transposase n=1 Tax=Marinifilum fragile TaxID=570161 RepID=UPI003570A127